MVAYGSDDDPTRSFTALATGTRISHYTIMSKIGAGGMGEVYLAEDTELHRKVALKFLPAHLCPDEDCRKRFKREAQAAAKLDHPNIVPIHEVSEFQGRPFFAMARIEGRSLRDVIREGKLTVEQSIAYTKQICEGLHKAHESGVVHRDIKPGNVIIDTEDRVRIVDFGLATVSGEEKLTKTGSTLGTVGYMSPEQIEGKHVDLRSDIFSVGVILYEMLTGRRPFEGETDAAVAHSIVSTTPEPIARYKSGTTGELQQIVDKCLSKDTSLRYQSASDVVVDLKRLQSPNTEPTLPVRRTNLRKKSMILAAAIALFALIVVIVVYAMRPKVDNLQEIKRKKLTTTGNAFLCKPSPTNNEIAYIAQESYGDARLVVQDLISSSSAEVFRASRINSFDWSPDGARLVVTSVDSTELSTTIVTRVGKVERRFPVWGLEVAWSPDGTRLVYPGPSKSAILLSTASGDSSSIAIQGAFDWISDVQWMNDSRHLIAVEIHKAGARLQVIDDQGDLGHVLIDSLMTDWCEVSTDDRWVYFVGYGEAKDLFRLRIDPTTYERVSDPVLVASGLSTDLRVSLSKDGKVAYYSQSASHSNLWGVTWGGVGSKTLTKVQLTRGSDQEYYPSISPDGQRIAFARKSAGSVNIYTIGTDGRDEKRITFSGKANNYPAWSPSGQEIAFKRWDWDFSLIVSNVEGTVRWTLPTKKLAQDFGVFAWSPGKSIAFTFDGLSKVGTLDPNTFQIDTLLSGIASVDVFYSLHYSPDGREIAMARNEFQQGEHGTLVRESSVGVLSCDTKELRLLVQHLKDPTLPIGWTADGRSILCQSVTPQWNALIERIPVDGNQLDTLFFVPWRNVSSPVAVVNDTTFVCTVEQALSDVWTLTGISTSN